MLPEENILFLRFKAFLNELTSTYRYYTVISIAALVALGIVVLFFKGGLSEENAVEIINTAEGQTNEETIGEVIVEVSGQVEKPGVYAIPIGSRVEDLLQKGGGVTEDADTEWMAKALNKAAKLTDGQKLYIPKKQRVASASSDTENPSNYQSIPTSAEDSRGDVEENVGRTIISESQNGLTNINSATAKELDKLPGIGTVYAQKIIEQRPYSEINELVSRKVVPKGTFEKFKDKISVY